MISKAKLQRAKTWLNCQCDYDDAAVTHNALTNVYPRVVALIDALDAEIAEMCDCDRQRTKQDVSLRLRRAVEG